MGKNNIFSLPYILAFFPLFRKLLMSPRHGITSPGIDFKDRLIMCTSVFLKHCENNTWNLCLSVSGN